MKAMKAILSMTLAASAALLVIAAPAQATFQGGGTAPSKAATIEWGQHYVAEMDNHRDNANYAGAREVSFWRLPPVSSRDVVVVKWESVPYTRSPGSFPICMMSAQGITDSNWGEVFDGGSCESSNGFRLSGSGTAESEVTIQDSDSSGNTYIEFWDDAYESSTSSSLETYKYNFTVERPRHYLNMTLSPFEEIPANGIVNAAVTGADGSPAPDGLTFGLTVRWNDNGIASYAATSVGGHVAFQLALPESAYKQHAQFIGGRGADGEYQAVETPVLHAKVTEPPPPPVVPRVRKPLHLACKRAKARAHGLARAHHRTAVRWHFARGIRRVKLHRRTRHLAKELRRAKARARLACG